MIYACTQFVWVRKIRGGIIHQGLGVSREMMWRVLSLKSGKMILLQDTTRVLSPHFARIINKLYVKSAGRS